MVHEQIKEQITQRSYSNRHHPLTAIFRGRGLAPGRCDAKCGAWEMGPVLGAYPEERVLCMRL